MGKFVKGIAPSVATYNYHRIEQLLSQYGYVFDVFKDMEIISGDNLITQYTKSYKIKSCLADTGITYYIKDNASPLVINMLGYADKNLFGEDLPIVYNLSAKIDGTDFDWEGESNSLVDVRDSFLEDANSGILNAYSNYDYIVDSNNLKIEEKLEKSIVCIYESLYKQIKENTDNDSALKELDDKIDVIMDALGLKDDEQNKETKDENNTENNVTTEDEEDVDIELSDTPQVDTITIDDEDNDEEINFVEA